LRQAAGRLVAAAALGGSVIAAPAPVAGGSDPNVTFSMRMGDCTVAGESDPNIAFRVIVRSKGGDLLLREDIPADGQPGWNAGCLDRPVAAGQQIEIRQNGGLVRLFIVQPLTIRADRAGDVLSGRGPAGSQVQVTVNACGGVAPACQAVEVLDEAVAVGVDGRWSLNTAPHDLLGGDGLVVAWESTFGDTFFWNQGVPYVEVKAGSATVTGRGPTGTTQRVDVRTAGGVLRGSGSATITSPFGSWSATVRMGGAKVRVRVDDRVSIVGQDGPALRARAFDLQVLRAQDRATGTCFPDRAVGVRVIADGNLAMIASGTAEPDGTWEIDGLDGMQAGWLFQALCANGQGDLVRTVRTIS
jgi:hypothetical protein